MPPKTPQNSQTRRGEGEESARQPPTLRVKIPPKEGGQIGESRSRIGAGGGGGPVAMATPPSPLALSIPPPPARAKPPRDHFMVPIENGTVLGCFLFAVSLFLSFCVGLRIWIFDFGGCWKISDVGCWKFCFILLMECDVRFEY